MNIKITDILLSYEEFGEGIPVICLHGFCVDSNLMKGCLEPVFQKHDKYRRIYLDLVGMGNSPSNKLIKNSDDMLKLVSDFIIAMVGNGNFILVGESFGGYLSLGLIEQFSNQISGLFLICPCVIGDNTKRVLPQKQIVKQNTIIVDDSEKEDYESFLEMAVVINTSVWERYKKEVLVGVKKSDFPYLNLLSLNGYVLSCEKDFNKISFDKPAVFLLGKQDHVVGYEDSLKLEPKFSRGTFAVIDSAGHNLQLERPELFSAFTEDFLSKIEIISL